MRMCVCCSQYVFPSDNVCPFCGCSRLQAQEISEPGMVLAYGPPPPETASWESHGLGYPIADPSKLGSEMNVYHVIQLIRRYTHREADIWSFWRSKAFGRFAGRVTLHEYTDASGLAGGYYLLILDHSTTPPHVTASLTLAIA